MKCEEGMDAYGGGGVQVEVSFGGEVGMIGLGASFFSFLLFYFIFKS
jgi:hypothetical protein